LDFDCRRELRIQKIPFARNGFDAFAELGDHSRFRDVDGANGRVEFSGNICSRFSSTAVTQNSLHALIGGFGANALAGPLEEVLAIFSFPTFAKFGFVC